MNKLPVKPNRQPNSEGQYTCYKCKKNKAAINGRERACKSCFLQYIENGFRNNLKRAITPTQYIPFDRNYLAPKYLVSVSGGINSTSTLHLAYTNQKAYLEQIDRITKGWNSTQSTVDHMSKAATEPKNQYKLNKAFFPISIIAVHIDTSILFDGVTIDPPEPCLLSQWIEESYEIPYLRIPIGFSLIYPEACSQELKDGDQDAIFRIVSNSGLANQVRKYFQSIILLDPKTSKHILKILCLRDIWAAAHCLQVSGIILGDSADVLAHTALSMLCQGEGINIPDAVSYHDSRFPNCDILRPLKSINNKEIFFYHYFNKLKAFQSKTSQLFSLIERSLTIPKHLNPSSTSSIPPSFITDPKGYFPLIGQFLSEISVDFPSTIMNINQTCAKLSPNTTNITSHKRCKVCIGLLDNPWQKSHSQSTFFNNLNSNYLGIICSGCLNNIRKLPILNDLYNLMINAPMIDVLI